MNPLTIMHKHCFLNFFYRAIRMQNVDQPADVRGNCLFVTVINETLPLATDWHQDVILEAQTFVSRGVLSIVCFISLTPKKKILSKSGYEKGRRKSEKIFPRVNIP